jgi:hypothetical protein
MTTDDDDYVPSDEDATWIRNLSKSRNGQNIRDHLSCLSFITRGAVREDALRQVLDFRRVFIHAFAKADQCFGLPRPTPRVVVIYNFSGMRGITYSANIALVRALCLVGPLASKQTLRGVDAVLAHAEKNETSLLLCYSLPWQSGINSGYWDLRALKRSKEGVVLDDFCYSSSMDAARSVAPTQTTTGNDVRVLNSQTKAFSDNFSASSVDVENTMDDESTEPCSEHAVKLRSLVNVLKSDRKKLNGDLNALKDDHKEAMIRAERNADERVGKILESSKNTESLLKLKNHEMTELNNTQAQENAELQRQIRVLLQEKAEQDLLHVTEIAKMKSTNKVNNATIKSLQEMMASSERAHKKELGRFEKMENMQNKSIESIERRLSAEQMALRRIQAENNALRDENERSIHFIDKLKSEREFERYQHTLFKRRSIGFKCALAVACCRMAAAKKQLDKNKKTTTEVACLTEPMQLPEKFTNLETEFGKLHAEHEALTSEKTKLLEKINKLEQKENEDKKVMMNGHAPDMVVALPKQEPTDPAIESMIAQATSSLKAVSDLARQSAQHQKAADCYWGELSALKQLMPYGNLMMAPPQHQQPYYWERPAYMPAPRPR